MKPHRFRIFLAAVFLTTAGIGFAAESHAEHAVRVIDAAGQPVQYGYICLEPRGLTQRCDAIDPFGPTVFVLPKQIHDANVIVYVPGFQHSEHLPLERGQSPHLYVIDIPVS